MKKIFALIILVIMITSIFLCSCSTKKDPIKIDDEKFNCCYCFTPLEIKSTTFKNGVKYSYYNQTHGTLVYEDATQTEYYYECGQCDEFFPKYFEKKCPECSSYQDFGVSTIDDCYECQNCGYQLIGEDIKKCKEIFVEIQEWLESIYYKY